MGSESFHAVGIDLGTTYSAVAYLDDLGRPQTVPNVEGDNLTPSVVLIDGKDIVVGKEALKALATDADNVAQCAKRFLGDRLFDRTLGDRQYPPEALQGMILGKLRAGVSKQIGPFDQTVITVPAYFDEVRRKATQDAGYIAGLDVLDIINEPTAAAIAFGFRQGLIKTDGTTAEKATVLVYDLGGGTFDVTVMEISENEFVALATDGDVHLGGHDWDHRVVDFVAEEFIRTHGIDPREDAITAARMWRDCEDAKRTLSSRSKVSIACDYKGLAILTELTRQCFQEITQDLLDRTAFTTRQTLSAAGLKWDDIDSILLVGGSSRMTAVGDMLAQLSGKMPYTTVSADEAVAHGAALHAGLLLTKARGQTPHFKVKNVNSHSLGAVGTDPRTLRPRTAIVIPRNTPLPVAARRIFKTEKADQRSVLIRIVEGESTSPGDCIQIGRCTVRDLPAGLPANTPVEVKFCYQENGRLTVTVRVKDTDIKIKYSVTRENSLSQLQLDSWRKFVVGLSVDQA